MKCKPQAHCFLISSTEKNLVKKWDRERMHKKKREKENRKKKQQKTIKTHSDTQSLIHLQENQLKANIMFALSLIHRSLFFSFIDIWSIFHFRFGLVWCVFLFFVGGGSVVAVTFIHLICAMAARKWWWCGCMPLPLPSPLYVMNKYNQSGLFGIFLLVCLFYPFFFLLFLVLFFPPAIEYASKIIIFFFRLSFVWTFAMQFSFLWIHHHIIIIIIIIT